MVVVTICSDFEAPKKKSVTVSILSLSICHEVMGPDAMIFVFWMLSYKSTFSLSSSTFIKRLFSSSSISAIMVVSSEYLKLLIFLLAILIPASASSSPTFHMMYSAYKLNKQGDILHPWCTPFLIWNQSIVPYPVLTVASCPVYRLLRRQVRWSGIPISGSSAFSKSSLNSWSSWFTYSWSLAWKFLSITLLACEMCAIMW